MRREKQYLLQKQTKTKKTKKTKKRMIFAKFFALHTNVVTSIRSDAIVILLHDLEVWNNTTHFPILVSFHLDKLKKRI